MVLPYLKGFLIYILVLFMVNTLVSLMFRVYFLSLWWILSDIFEVLLQVVSKLFRGNKVGEFLDTK